MRKLKPRLDDKFNLLLSLGGPVITDLLNWLDASRNVHESIDVHSWVGDWWYIVIKDERIKGCPENMLLGFTVNIKADVIMWVNHTAFNPSGGNCFCRSHRWVRFLRSKLPNVRPVKYCNSSNAEFHDYRDKNMRLSRVIRGCRVEAESGASTYFGHNPRQPEQTRWWKVTFPNHTWIKCANLKTVRDCINSEQWRFQGSVV